MARYAVEADLLARMSDVLKLQLFDDDRSGAVDAGLIDLVLTEACDEFDLETSGRYDPPLTGTVPAGVKLLVLDLAWYRAHQRKNLQTDTMVKDYERTIERCRRINDNLTGVGGARPAERSGLAATIGSNTRILGRAGMANLP